MPRPSPVQYHATVMVAVFLVLVGLAVFAFWSHHGVGPFEGKVQQFTVPPGGSLVVVATVQNQGSKAARATCRITALDTSDTPEGAETVLTEQIPAGGTVTLRHEFADVTVPPASVSITCT